jgi:hypothetical protein
MVVLGALVPILVTPVGVVGVVVVPVGVVGIAAPLMVAVIHAPGPSYEAGTARAAAILMRQGARRPGENERGRG